MKKAFLFLVLGISSTIMAQVSPIELYLPIDKDTLRAAEIPFTFSFLIDPIIGLNPRYKSTLTLVELNKDQSLQEALSMNEPILATNVFNLSSLPYPSSAPKLKTGKTYVWRIQTVEGGNLVYQSDFYQFTIFDPPLSGNYFEITKRSSTKLCKAIDGIIYLTLESKFISEEIKVELYKAGVLVEGVSLFDVLENFNYSELIYTNRIGMNYYTFDFASHRLDQGIYEMRLYTKSQGDLEIKIQY